MGYLRMNRVGIIGDIHGNLEYYRGCVRHYDRTIQVGDMGFADTYIELMRDYNPEHHKFIPGNHDNYDALPPHALGDFGPLPFIENGFYARGGRSIDKDVRVEGVSWWRQEELTYARAQEAITAYLEAKPDIMISHEAPSCCLPFIGSHHVHFPASFTARFLYEMFDQHQPSLWIFGHHHRSWRGNIRGTQFVCLAEGERLTLEETNEVTPNGKATTGSGR